MSEAWVLVVAGADSSARAGIAADREAIEVQGLAQLSVVSAWTSQGTGGVRSFSPLEPSVWHRIAERELARGPRALKFGLLPGAEHVAAAAALTEQALDQGIPVVLDPVLRSSSGFCFLDTAGVQRMREELIPQGIVLTPNLMEGLALLELGEHVPLECAAQRLAVGKQIMELGPRAVLLKGGHGKEDPVLDLVLEKGQEARFHRHPRLAGRSMGGTGCRYASSVAAGLAQGLGLFEAAERAGNYVAQRIAGC